MDSSHTRRRIHSAQLKEQVLAECAQPGASVAAVALGHDLNANLVHKWRRRNARRTASPREAVTPPAVKATLSPSGSPSGVISEGSDVTQAFVAVGLERSGTQPTAPQDIRLELRRGAAMVVVSWPAREAQACGNWLREWLR